MIVLIILNNLMDTIPSIGYYYYKRCHETIYGRCITDGDTWLLETDFKKTTSIYAI